MCKQTIYILFLPIHSCSMRLTPGIWYHSRNMKYWNYPTIHSNSHSLPRPCPTLRADTVSFEGQQSSLISFQQSIHWHKPTERTWDEFSVDKASLTRFFAFYFIPFTITALATTHLLFLHKTGFKEPYRGVSSDINKISFHTYYMIKDMLGAY